MYRIFILTDHTDLCITYAKQVKRFCTEHGLFPQIEFYTDQEEFFNQIIKVSPTGIILDLPGVAGLNAAEHIRTLIPNCGLIWCCDLDFSVHAFKLRADYFILSPVREEHLHQGLTIWIEYSKRQNYIKQKYTKNQEGVVQKR